MSKTVSVLNYVQSLNVGGVFTKSVDCRGISDEKSASAQMSQEYQTKILEIKQKNIGQIKTAEFTNGNASINVDLGNGDELCNQWQIQEKVMETKPEFVLVYYQNTDDCGVSATCVSVRSKYEDSFADMKAEYDAQLQEIKDNGDEDSIDLENTSFGETSAYIRTNVNSGDDYSWEIQERVVDKKYE